MKYLMTLFLFMTFATSYGQDVFQKYNGHPEVTYIRFPQTMFSLLSKIKVNATDENAEAFLEMIKTLKEFRVLSTKNESIAEEMHSWLQAEYKNTPLMSIINLTEANVNVQFGAVFGSDQSKVKRLVMLVKGLDDFVKKNPSINLDTQVDLDYILLEIKGDLQLDQIASLTQLVDIPGGKYLDALGN